jgi:capsule polysaccharide export protein KpsC/LpsZ
VPGQIEDDASILLGCRDIRDNVSLLAEVRRQNPDAFIKLTTPEDVIDELVSELDTRPVKKHVSPLRRKTRKLWHALLGILGDV